MDSVLHNVLRSVVPVDGLDLARRLLPENPETSASLAVPNFRHAGEVVSDNGMAFRPNQPKQA